MTTYHHYRPEDAAEWDRTDPLADLRQHFTLPPGIIYLDGNSLGALPRTVKARLEQVITEEWGRHLIQSWNQAGWYEMPRRVGDKIAALIGADAGEVVVADSTSVNLFKALAGALRLRPERKVILTEAENFPTDLYMVQGLIDLLGGIHRLERVSIEALSEAISEQTALVLLTHVNYRTGAMHDMETITAQAHAQGALMIWDLAHSAGAVPLHLNAAGVDLAVGCGYKYLNGGPGAPAFIFVAKHHQREFIQPLSGWLGHTDPFAFAPDYQPAEGIARAQVGTQAVLSMSALECGIDLMLETDMSQLREKSLRLSAMFMDTVAMNCPELTLITPRNPHQRGSQVSFCHPEGYAMIQALIAQGIIGDFRAPDILRFGFAPAYLRYTEVWDAAQALIRVVKERLWDQPAFKRKNAVT